MKNKFPSSLHVIFFLSKKLIDRMYIIKMMHIIKMMNVFNCL